MSRPGGRLARLTGREDIHVIAAVTAVIAWGIGPVFNRSMSVSTPTIVFFRIAVGLPIMVTMSYLAGDGLNRRLVRSTAVPGMLFGASMIFGFAAIKMTSIANATLIGNLQPVIIMFVAPKVLGERLRARQVGIGAVALAGVLTVVLAAASTSGASFSGDVMAVVNVCIWVAYFVIAKRRRTSGVDGWSFLAAVFCWAAVVVLPYGAIASNDLGGMQPRDWLLIICMALGPGIVGHGLMTWSQSHIDVTLASILGLLGPVVSTSLAWVVFGQSLTQLQMLGGAVVIVSLALLVRDQRGAAEPLLEHEI